jgi:hypothetical protein
VAQESSISYSSLQHDFQNISDGDGLNCIVPPPGGDFWPFGGKHSPDAPPPVPEQVQPHGNLKSASSMSVAKKVAISVAVVVAVGLVAFLFWFSRRRQRQYQAAVKSETQSRMLSTSTTSS